MKTDFEKLEGSDTFYGRELVRCYFYSSDKEAKDIESFVSDLGYDSVAKFSDSCQDNLFINEDYFEEYIEDMLHECGDLPVLPSYIYIDWGRTLSGLERDYINSELRKTLFFCRSY